RPRGLRHHEVQRHVEGVVERSILGVEEIEPALDALFDHRPRERLVDVEAVAIGAKGALALASHVDPRAGTAFRKKASTWSPATIAIASGRSSSSRRFTRRIA